MPVGRSSPGAIGVAAEVDPVEGATSEAGCRRLAVVAAVVFGGTFVLYLAAALTTPSVLERDWVAFDRAGDRAAGGGWAAAYRESAGEQHPFLYPPYALWLTVPLSWFGPTASYLAVLAAILGAMAVATWAVRSLVPGGGIRTTCWLCASLASGTFLHVVTTGQCSALWLATILTGTVARRRGHPRWAGAAWAVLLLKPNLAVGFAAYLVLRRDRRALEGFALGALVALLAAVPLGLAPWHGFADALGVVDRLVADIGNWWGQVTLLASFRVVLEPAGAAWLATPLWAAVCVALGLACTRRWWRAGATSGLDELRLVGTVCLFVVVANPRLYFYDALLLAVPAAAWSLRVPGADGPSRRAVAIGLAAIVAAGYAPFAGVRLSPVIGPVALGWLLVELTALRRAEPRATRRSQRLATDGRIV